MGQTLTGLVVGAAYEVTFFASQRPGYVNAGMSVLVDGQLVLAVPEVVGGFHTYTAVFTAGAATATVRFQNSAVEGGDNGVFLDAVTLQERTLEPDSEPVMNEIEKEPN